MSESRVGVCFAGGDAEADRARQLAAELALPVVDCDDASFALVLEVTPQRLQTHRPGSKMGPVFCDFVGGPLGFRRRIGAEQSGMLARAVGWKRQPLKVVDATAGLGRDAFMLALLGCEVTAVERSPVLFALLRDGLERAMREPEIAEALGGRLRLVHADGRQYLSSVRHDEIPGAGVVYLDPMFPERRKSAQVKKEMVLCRLAAGEDEDADELLAAALAAGVHRIAVKRPLHAPPLGGPPPTLAMKGTAVRFDVYIQA